MCLFEASYSFPKTAPTEMLFMFFLQYMPLAASQCMEINPKIKGCLAEDRINNRSAYVESTSNILECMDMCLASTDLGCQFIQWNHYTMKCYRYNVTGENQLQRLIGNCLTLDKKSCVTLTDPTCLEEDSGPVYDDSYMVRGFEKEIECRTVCLFSTACMSYVWNNEELFCVLQTNHKPQRPHRELKNVELHMKKRQNCKGDHCALFKIAANADNGKLEKSAQTISMCLERLLKRNDVFMLDWNYDHSECFLHELTHGRYESYYRPTFNIAQVIKPESCTLKTSSGSVHVKTHQRARMEGGFPINMTSETECVEFCKHIANCAAVDWNHESYQCIFHHVEKPLKRKAHGYTHHCPIYGKKDEIIATYYVRQGGRVRSARDQKPCFQCAFQCQRQSCAGFTCLLQDDSSQYLCLFTDVRDAMYTPVVKQDTTNSI